MIPRTFPSIIEALQTKMVVYVLPSITGLTAWIDYIPVKGVTTESNALANTYALDGYQVVKTIESLTGKQAWLDYIPVFESAAYNKPWSTDAGGYIPAGGLFSIASLFANGEQGTWYDPSDVNLNWRYNLLTYTEQFDNAAWVKTNATVTANSATAPSGTTTADKLSENNTAGSHQTVQSIGTASSAATYTQSVYLKNDGARYAVLAFYEGSTGTNIFAAQYDLQSGVITGYAKSGGNTPTATIEAVGNGWYYCTLTATTTTGGPSAQFQLWLNRAGTFTSNPYNYTGYTGDGTSGIFIWGAQLQTGSVATTYQQIVTPEISYLNYQPQPVLFQDPAGTTPVTAVQQPVGLMLDKSKGLVLGPELVTNGGFDGATGWTIATPATTTIVGGSLVFNNAATADLCSQTASQTWVSGKTYRLNFEVSNYSGSGQITISRFGQQNIIVGVTGNGPKQAIFVANNSTASSIGINPSSGWPNLSCSIDNISVKELPGNHAFQTTSASRPVLSARYNLLTKTEQFDDAVWIKGASGAALPTVTLNYAIAPNGTQTAAKIDFPSIATSAAFSELAQNVTTVAATYSRSLRVKAFAAGDVGKVLHFYYSSPVLDVQAITLTAEWQTVTFSTSLTAAARAFNFGVIGPTYGGTTQAAVSALVWGADLRVSNDALGQPAYQRVNTSTDYDTVGFKPYLAFDGVDDSLVTNSIDFTATDKMTVFAGVRKLSDAARGVSIELSASTAVNAGSFVLTAPEGATSNYGFGSRGSILNSPIAASPFAAPITNVLAGLGDISGDLATLRVNGTQAATSTADQGTGNYGNYPLYIGRRGGSGLPFNGRLYSLIVRGAASTTAQITSTETYVNQKTGAY